MEADFNPNIPQPDPDWDYYELWQMAYQVHEKLEQAIKYMTVVEHADDSTDERLRQQFFELSEMCEECSHATSGDGLVINEDLTEED